MYLTTVTGTQIIEAAHHQRIIIETPESITPGFRYGCGKSTWDAETPPGSPTAEDGAEKLKDVDLSAAISSVTILLDPVVITLASGVAYAIFLDDELTEIFQQIHGIIGGSNSNHLGTSVAIENLVRSRFDLINPKLTINTGPVVLNDVLEALWLKPLGEARACYILRKEEFVSCFLSWANKQETRGTSNGETHHPAERSEILKSSSSRVRMPIGRTCCHCPEATRKTTYLELPYTIWEEEVRTKCLDGTKVECSGCGKEICNSCVAKFGWF